MSRKSNFKLYRVWDGIVQRCNNPNAKNYQNYGGRGIKMSDAWRKDFSEFEKYCMANGWEYGLQVDRINNNGNYEPSNCRWTNWKTQASNRRKPAKIKNQYGEWDYRSMPQPPKVE